MEVLAASDGTGMNPMSFTDQHGSVVLERLRYQRETGRFCDVSIVVKDRNFSAHRNVLAACSPYFDSILKSTKVAKEQVIVNCQHPCAFDLLLSYMYSGSVVIDRSTVSELLRLSNNFLIIRLKNYCAEYLDRYLDAANCLSVRQLANKFNLPALLRASSEYFDVNINRCLLESQDILRYPLAQVEKIISDPKYHGVITPDVHLKLIVRWAGEELSLREGCFRQLLEACPVHEVNDSTLDFVLDYSPLFTKSPRSKFLLLQTMNEAGMPMQKYEQQYISLSSQFGGDNLNNSNMDYDYDDEGLSSGDGMDEEDYDEAPLEGHPTTSEVLEMTTDENGVEKPRLKLKISLGGLKMVERKQRGRPSLNSDRPRVYRKGVGGPKKRGRPKRNEENDIIPMLDDDNVDGVYATASLEHTVTYTDEDFLDPEDVEDGEDNPVEGGPYACGFCKFACTLDEDLEKHRARQHNRNTMFMCQLCEFECNWSKPYYEHCREHWPQGPYQCDQCDFQTPTMQTFLAHRLGHTQDRYFKCMECNYRLRSRTQLWAHERLHSSLDERPAHCDECGRGFGSVEALQQHMSGHDDPRAMACEECGFATNNMDGMTAHRRQHTGDIFFCHIDGCEYSSPKKSQLAAHLRTHMAVRAHKCTICGRGFIEKSHLVRHERIHLDEKPFKCDTCDYASSRRDKLKEHILKHHNGSAGTRMHRRRYKREKQLAVARAQAAMPDAMFRPIPVSENVSRWTEQQQFQQSMSPQHAGGHPTTSQHPVGAFMAARPSSMAIPKTSHMPISPGSISLMNVNLAGPDTPPVGSKAMISGMGAGGLSQPLHTTPGLVTPTPQVPRSPHNRSDPFGINTPTDMFQRPMSLPPYGQMQQGGGDPLLGGTSQQTQQQSQQPTGSSWMNPW